MKIGSLVQMGDCFFYFLVLGKKGAGDLGREEAAIAGVDGTGTAEFASPKKIHALEAAEEAHHSAKLATRFRQPSE